MLYCPSCGTANRDGSRFCNNCGHKLPSKTGIMCPMCGHMNPADNVYCDNCKARLVPAAPGAPPAAPPGGAAAAPAAPIKTGLSLPTKPSEEAAPSPAEPQPVEPEAEPEPDWLVRLRAAAPRPAETPSEEALPTVEPQPASPDEMPEWMHPTESEVPDWFQRLSEPAPSSQAAPEPTEAPVPDWMKELGIEPPATAKPEAEEPDWLSQLRGPSGPAPESKPEPATPGWLESLEAAPEAGQVADSDLPDWLKEIGVGTESAPQPAAVEPVETTGEPDWLASLRAESSAEAPVPEVSAELDWLAGLGEQPAAETPAAAPAEAAPDWLAAIEEQPAAEPTEAEAPDWLSHVAGVSEAPSVEEPAAVSEAPAWLLDLSAPPGASVPAGEAEAPPAETEAPDWLRAIAASREEPLQPAAPSPPASTFVGEDVGEAPAQAPDWLSDLGQAATGPVEMAEAPQAELPDWLQDLGPLPSGPARTLEEAPFGEAAPAMPGEIPEWLRVSQPGQPAPAFADESGQPLAPALEPSIADSTGLEQASLPPWLQALRPSEVTTRLEAAAGITETEGLLAGLQNVLPAAPVMGRQHGAPAVRQAQLPPADLARAGLLQELLGRGALAPTVVMPGRARAGRLRARLSRWLIALSLLAAVFVPNGSPIVSGLFRLGGVDPNLYRPAADAIEALASGDRVLMAFDYDAFQAGEMDPIAQAFLTHIRQRGAEVIAFSLNPIGPALADRVADRMKAAGLPDASFVDRRYAPGQAIGAQSALALAGVAETDLVVVLAGSPEALRWWVEQIAAAGADAPLVAGLSAGALPQAQPYLLSGQVKASVTGMIGGLAYQRALDAQPDREDADGLDRIVRSEALVLAQLVFAVVLIAGLIVSLLTGARRAT
jgi:hypothetical protein